MIWSFYDIETGKYTGKKFRGSLAALALNTPPGTRAVEGEAEFIAPSTASQQRDAMEQILNLEASQQRAIREAVLKGDLSYLQSIDDQIKELRPALNG